MTLRSVDPFLDRRFDRTRYNCLDFAAEVWMAAEGQDVRALLDGLVSTAPADRRVRREHRRAFVRLDRPHDPCLVLMQRTRSTPHAGVYVRGRILHLKETGVEYQPAHIAALGFDRVGYYLPHGPQDPDPRG